jgi:hypothetical protein
MIEKKRSEKELSDYTTAKGFEYIYNSLIEKLYRIAYNRIKIQR